MQNSVNSMDEDSEFYRAQTQRGSLEPHQMEADLLINDTTSHDHFKGNGALAFTDN